MIWLLTGLNYTSAVAAYGPHLPEGNGNYPPKWLVLSEFSLIKYWLWYWYVAPLSKNTQLCLAMNVFYKTLNFSSKSHTINIGWSANLLVKQSIHRLLFASLNLRRKKRNYQHFPSCSVHTLINCLRFYGECDKSLILLFISCFELFAMLKGLLFWVIRNLLYWERVTRNND